MAEKKEPKNQRISKNQKEKLVEYMSTHLEFARGQIGSINGNAQIQGDWLALTTTLNSLGGSNKTTDQWKKCWVDLKSAVKKKLNSKNKFVLKTGGGSIKDGPNDLNDFEEQILSIMGTHAVHGDPTAVESGVAPIPEPMLSIEVLEEDFIEDPSILTLDESRSEPPPKIPKINLLQFSSEPRSKQATMPPAHFKTGIEEAREMHAVMLNDIKQMDLKIDSVAKKIENMEKQNNALFEKFDFLINLFQIDK